MKKIFENGNSKIMGPKIEICKFIRLKSEIWEKKFFEEVISILNIQNQGVPKWNLKKWNPYFEILKIGGSVRCPADDVTLAAWIKTF